MATTLLVIDPDSNAKIKQRYSLYKVLWSMMGMDILSERRIRDHINTLKMFGLIDSQVTRKPDVHLFAC
ncbi:hypothetical protein [Haloprofundus halobius]|uniref:hypothetical protein n=1 Tax=Haloprofundus halobius TaxID=2876194 RepID=UPI001CCBD35F|nr:hypothetical protein [Haloprofundus halobius]